MGSADEQHIGAPVRCCFAVRLNPGMGPTYDRLHDEMGPEVREAIGRAGFERMTMFRHDDLAVGYAEVRGLPDHAFARLGTDDAFGAWAAGFDGVFLGGAGDDGIARVEGLAEVWHMGSSSADGGTARSSDAASDVGDSRR